MRKNPTYLLLTIILIHISISSNAQEYRHSGKIYHDLQKLGVLANIMYIAAHPDDENTRVISYFANEVKADTRYLSLTRGDGGQNLIGSELKEYLGVIRTHELLEARKIDGGSQRFSRAIDFGYSKNAEETMTFWETDEILSDVVWAIRKFRPDVIINRFDHRTSGKTHGHHTASAILSIDAYHKAGDANAFKDQLKSLDPWQPSHILFNTSWWFYGSREAFAEADKSNLIAQDIGSYYPMLGTSNNEIAAYSRSMHKCQGMGATPARGAYTEYFEILESSYSDNTADIFEGINTSWSRIPEGNKIQPLYESILSTFDHGAPQHSLPDLLRLRTMISTISDTYWRDKKIKEIDHIIEDCLGLHIHSKLSNEVLTQDQNYDLDVEIIARNTKISVQRVYSQQLGIDTTLNTELKANSGLHFKKEFSITNTATTEPYWLTDVSSAGMYRVDDAQLIGIPKAQSPISIRYDLSIDGTPFTIEEEPIYRRTDPERGEVISDVHILQDAYINPASSIYIYPDKNAQQIGLTVTAMADIEGRLDLGLSGEWIVSPRNQEVKQKAGSEQLYTFTVTPRDRATSCTVSPTLNTSDGSTYRHSIKRIAYDHIPTQYVALPSSFKIERFELKTTSDKLLYINGAGDDVAANLQTVGYNIQTIDPAAIASTDLNTYSVIITGIRAFNKSPELVKNHSILMEYVKNGGHLIIQYNTSRRFPLKQLGPYPISLSRDRISEEDAALTMLAPNHPIFNYPNKITQVDFEDWVQERGLYFANSWDDAYTPLLSGHDRGETDKKGGLLVCNYGKGSFVYSGLSWFRQLPAGVPGAFKLFSNIIAYKNHE